MWLPVRDYWVFEKEGFELSDRFRPMTSTKLITSKAKTTFVSPSLEICFGFEKKDYFLNYYIYPKHLNRLSISFQPFLS